jgi:hypothetical protein
MLLPGHFVKMQQQLVASINPAAREKAAGAILPQYCNYIDKESLHQQMQLLLNATLTHPHLPAMANGSERHNLLLYYEFTLMMIDALYSLHAAE